MSLCHATPIIAETPIQPCSFSLPICVQESRVVYGTPTDFSLQRFSDQTVLFITQIGRIGTYITCSIEDNGLIDDGSTMRRYQTVTLLGSRDNTFAEVCARQILEQICQYELGLDNNSHFLADGHPVPSLLLGITLKEKEPTRECMQELIASVINLFSRSSSHST